MSITYARTCEECGEETYQYERRHKFGDVLWKNKLVLEALDCGVYHSDSLGVCDPSTSLRDFTLMPLLGT